MFRPPKLALVLPVLASVLALITRAFHVHDHAADPHVFIPPGPGDSRSPCPALNVLANHGYISRSGKDISPLSLVRALQSVYALDAPTAHFLALGGFFLVNHPAMTQGPDMDHPLAALLQSLHGAALALAPDELLRTLATLHEFALDTAAYGAGMDLERLGLHDHIEHDASLTHDDAPSGSQRLPAPWRTNASLFDELLADSASGTHITLRDIGTARVRRERQSLEWSGRPMDPLHQIIARGEPALVVSIFGESVSAPSPPSAAPAWEGADWTWTPDLGVPFATMRTWWLDERMPRGFVARRTTSAQSTQRGNDIVGQRMAEMRAAADARARAQELSKDTAPPLHSAAPAAHENATDAEEPWTPEVGGQVPMVGAPVHVEEGKA